MPAREAALARGFVLGEDEEVDAATAEDFRRAGLSHLLAVSGENVTLLALLATALLGALGISLRERQLWVLGLIAVYVPLAGAGPSIQRAAVMGGVGVVATLAGRRSSRLYALVLALGVTLAIDPRVAGDVGWQLSFAAVIGILLIAAPLRGAIVARLGPGAWRRALAEGAAVTIAATLATAPLIAFYFETFSTTTLVANVLAMPAVAPAMWLGMVAAAASQVPGLPVQVLQRPRRAVPRLHRPGRRLVRPAELGRGPRPAWRRRPGRLLSGARGGDRSLSWPPSWRRLAARGRPSPAPPMGPERTRPSRQQRAAGSSGRGARASRSRRGAAPARVAPELRSHPDSGLRVEVLDVGQGDAILLQPAGAPALLVDGGPPGDDLASNGRGGVDRLGAAVVTHDQSDHAAGIEELLGRLPVARLVYARLGGDPLAEARSAGAVPLRIAAGSVLRSGRPPHRRGLAAAGAAPSSAIPGAPTPSISALVLLARWHNFSMLLTADAEAESVPLDPGPVDVLKVAHHGSDDAGLGALLDRIRPRLAVISVGAGNSYGHPTAGTVATLAGHGIRTLRTDLDGTVTIDVRPGELDRGRGGQLRWGRQARH